MKGKHYVITLEVESKIKIKGDSGDLNDVNQVIEVSVSRNRSIYKHDIKTQGHLTTFTEQNKDKLNTVTSNKSEHDIKIQLHIFFGLSIAENE